jgi:hypothetical protein
MFTFGTLFHLMKLVLRRLGPESLISYLQHVLQIIMTCEVSGSHGDENVDVGPWIATPCGFVDRYQLFRGTYCLHLQG